MNKSELGLGTWQVSPTHGFWTGQDLNESRNVLTYALRRGLRHFDTAPSYGNGVAEQLLGSIVKNRCELYLATKFMPKTPMLVEQDLHKSLARLKTYYVDCLYLHWPSSRIELRPILESVLNLVEQGLVRQIGLCNTPLALLQELEDLPIASVQLPCSLLWIRSLTEIRAWAQEKHIKVVGYSPLGLGLLAGSKPQDGRKDLYVFKPEAYPTFQELLAYLGKLAEQKGCSQAQLALTWASGQGCSTILLGSRRVEQLEQLLDGNEPTLDETEYSMLDEYAHRLDCCAPRSWDNYFGYRW